MQVRKCRIEVMIISDKAPRGMGVPSSEATAAKAANGSLRVKGSRRERLISGTGDKIAEIWEVL
jgi:hypothetical protein